MSYDPKLYWEKRGQQYKVKTKYDFQEELIHLKYLFYDLDLFNNSILEVGPGYGRLYNTISPLATDYRMVDFVNSMRQRCLKRTGVLPDYWDGKILPYDDQSFHTTILFSVLLHVPPKDIHEFLWEVTRVTESYIFIATFSGKGSIRSNHCFNYDYKSIFYGMGLEVVSEKLLNSDYRVNYLIKVT